MQKIRISGSGTVTQPLSFEKTGDDWEKWNEERDLRIEKLFEREF
jgi:hypothetical protein